MNYVYFAFSLNYSRLKQFFQNSKVILVLKILVFLLLAFTVYEQVVSKQSLKQTLILFQHSISPIALTLLAITLLLMPVNWLIEARKWQLLIIKLEPISLWTAFKAILSGVTLAVITPYRLGDYAGRLVVLRKAEPLQAIAATVVGNFAQIIVTVIAGLASVWYYLFLFGHIIYYALVLLCLASILICYLLIDLYFRINLTGNLIKRFSFYSKISRYIDVLANYTHSELMSLLLLSATRYAVFVAQYLFLLSMFGTQIQFFTGLILVGVLFILQAVIPIELWIRGNLALFVFAPFTNNTLGILSASLTLWLINLILPSIAGSIILFLNKNKSAEA